MKITIIYTKFWSENLGNGANGYLPEKIKKKNLQ